MKMSSLEILNPWWSDPSAIDADPHIRAVAGKPFYFDNPLKHELGFDKGQRWILRGARQVGKTTLIKEVLAQALKQGRVDAANGIFITCENIEHYDELQEMLVELLRARKGRSVLLCLDEITFVPEWQRVILWLINAGMLADAMLLISGSNARDLKESGERFPGRSVNERSLFPLSLTDYRSIPCFRTLSREALLETYLAVGGFPHAVRDFSEGGAVSDETCATYANWIFGDAYRFGLTRDVLLHILFRIYDTVGTQVTYQRLIEKSPVKSHETAAAYVEHLESAFLCHLLGCYDPDKDMAAPRKAKKCYFIDPLLYQVAGGYLRDLRNVSTWWRGMLGDDAFRGRIFESVVVSHMVRRHARTYYWYSSNTKQEVDVVVRQGDETRLFEVKMKPQQLKPIMGKPVSLITPATFEF